MGVTLTPNLTPNLGSFLLLRKSSFNSQSGVTITQKVGLFLLLTWVVFTLFRVTLTLRYRITPFLGLFLLLNINSKSAGIFTPEKEFFQGLFQENGLERLFKDLKDFSRLCEPCVRS